MDLSVPRRVPDCHIIHGFTMSTVVMGSSSSSPKVGHVGIEYAAARRMSDVCLVNLHAAIVSQTRGILSN